MAGQGAKAGGIGYGEEIAPTLKGAASGLNQVPCIFGCRGNGNGNVCPTITGDHESRVTDYTAICTYQDVTGPLMANSHPGGVTGQDAYSDMLIAFTQKRFGEYAPGIGTITANTGGGTSSSETILTSATLRSVRRVVPLECERLQGYPDGWTAIPGAKDTPRYKALGNSIALPVFYYVLYHISRYLPTDATLGSLFDGIGGFPLIWERLHGRGTARWASEIEPFPIAATAYRFSKQIKKN
ncbi:MAG: DNA cytosine methyltransferase [Acutalibacteraceae bacterium]